MRATSGEWHPFRWGCAGLAVAVLAFTEAVLAQGFLGVFAAVAAAAGTSEWYAHSGPVVMVDEDDAAADGVADPQCAFEIAAKYAGTGPKSVPLAMWTASPSV